MSMKNYREMRAWQAARAFKLGIYELIDTGSLASDERLRTQLREAAASAASHTSEGFGRFDPVDFARFLKMARASLIECQNHLQDAVDRKHITDSVRQAHDGKAQEALMEIGGLLDYLQSPEAAENAKRIKEARFARRRKRTENMGTENVGTENARTLNKRTSNARTLNKRTSNSRTKNKNQDPGTR
jgi:four helix bundle protein